jgi:hypothetical protein
MKRLWIVVLSALVLGAILYGVRMAERRATAGVAGVLPRGTIGFAHLPDFNRTIDEWHQSDIYQIYLEPAVQEFLKKPADQPSQAGSAAARLQEFQELKAKDAFVALTSIANDMPKLVAGFEYHCTDAVADRVIGGWRTKINPSAKRDQIDYEKHQIEVFQQSAFSLATVRDRNWFFASNDVDELKAVLDRADGRVKDTEALLSGDESFRNANAAMPAAYSMLLYLQPKLLIDRLATARQTIGQTPQQEALQQINSVCLATRFDHGKMHDLMFVGMPRQKHDTELTRSSLSLATRATIIYAASVIDFSKPAGILFATGGTNPLGSAAEKIGNALAAAGVKSDDWEAAFGSEISLLSEWPEQARWPSVVFAAAVKDPVRARKIADALAQGTEPGEEWTQTDRDGVHYWSLVSASGWFSMRPVMGLSDHMWVVGLDMVSIEETMKRATKPQSGLAETDSYRKAEGLLPAPTKFFSYVDLAQIYSRIDATVRPFLFMGAMFTPAANAVDLSKIPPVEAVTKHLSPIVSSQRYSGNGYVAESVGPVTLNQGAIGVAVLGGMGAMAYQRMNPFGALKGITAPATKAPAAGAVPSAGPTVTPAPSSTP